LFQFDEENGKMWEGSEKNSSYFEANDSGTKEIEKGPEANDSGTKEIEKGPLFAL
jgi:hypothetical protein